MAVQAGLRMSFHDMDVADAEFNTDTECESHGSEQERQKDNPSESEIFQQFLELWHEKGELLIYKAFVTRFPNCASWYDQITGSIPPESEIQIVTSEMFDSCTDTNDKEHLFAESSNKELVCYSTNHQEHLYSNASSNKEHIHSDMNNKEHFHIDRDSQEYLQQSDSKKESLCRDLQIETPQHEHCEGKIGPHIHSDVDVNVYEVTSMDTQCCSNECINDDCGSKEVCYESSDIVQSKLYQNDSCSTELPAAGEVTLKHNMISKVDVPIGGHVTEARDFPFQTGNCSDSDILFDNVVPSVSAASSVADSATQSAVEEDDVSDRPSKPGSESAVQLPYNEHCYTSRSFDDHSYTTRAGLPDSNGHCPDYCTDDGQDAAEEFGHGQLIARLQEAHEDLSHQVFLYVREIFSEWVRANPGEEFDVSSLDQYLLAVATPFTEVEFVYEQ